MSNEIEEIQREIMAFRDERDWEQFHNPKDLALLLSIESAELLEVFLWRKPNEVDPEKVKEELADVLYAALLIAQHYGLDVKSIIREKLASNAKKYPVDKAKGNKNKYDNL
jgi:NTP pyrophosphatase (non-canonical NTP hydrolase)